jgi:DNA-binding transcriptional LysR family regulator
LKGIEAKKREALRLPYFDWDKVKYFYYVVKLKGINEAAKYLNIAQPSLSRKIMILEDHLQCKLFTRTPKGLEITRKGEELFAIVEQMFLALKGFSYSLSVGTGYNRKRKIRIAATYLMAAFVLNEHLFAYQKENPQVIFELIGDDSPDIILKDVDMSIVSIDPSISNFPDEKGLIQEYLFSMEKRLYASNDYIQKYGAPQSVQELKNHRLLSVSNPEKHPLGDANWILKLGMPEGRMHEPVFTSNSLECIVDAAVKGHGILSSYSQLQLVKNSALINVLPHIKGKRIDQYISYPSFLENDEDIVSIKDFLRAKLK